MDKFQSSVSIVESESAMNDGSILPKSNSIPIPSTRKSGITALKGDGDVRVVTIREYKQAAQCLAEAFAEDDVARYFTHTPDTEDWSDADKWDLHVSILEYIVYAHILKGLVLTAGPDFGCVALWMPPGQNMDDWMTIMRSGMWRLNYRLSAEGKFRFFNEFFPLLHDTKHEVLGDRDDESWYLVYIGTKAAARGKGLARKLIDHVSAQADEQGRACYLESSNAINPIIYRKLGFEIVKSIDLTRAGKPIQLDIMIREPLTRHDSLMEKETKPTSRVLPEVSLVVNFGDEKTAAARAVLA